MMDWLRRKPILRDVFDGLGDRSEIPLAGGETEGVVPPEQVAEWLANKPTEWDNKHWSLALWGSGLLSPRIKDRSTGG